MGRMTETGCVVGCRGCDTGCGWAAALETTPGDDNAIITMFGAKPTMNELHHRNVLQGAVHSTASATGYMLASCRVGFLPAVELVGMLPAAFIM